MPVPVPEITSDSPYSAEFLAACAEIGLDAGEITNWEQTDDWANGERYRFSYERQSVLAYMNADETVNSIHIGLTPVYEQGYEPYNIEDSIVDEDTAMALIPYAEDTVKLVLNYPTMADFPFLDWGYEREGVVYILQSTVTATNGFGVPEEMPFTVMFDLSTEGKANCVYLELAGAIVSDDREPRPERQRVASENESSSEVKAGEIRLIDGELGEYGRKDPKYPEYMDYYVPAGTYSVSGNAKTSIAMIIDNVSNEEVSRATLASGQRGEITVGAGKHIELTMYSDITLVLIG